MKRYTRDRPDANLNVLKIGSRDQSELSVYRINQCLSCGQYLDAAPKSADCAILTLL